MNSRRSLLLIGLVVCWPLSTIAAHRNLPPSPEEPPYIEPIPLQHRMQVKATECEQGPEDSKFGFESTWHPESGTITVDGWVAHGGSESIDPSDVAAWLVGGRVVVFYELKRRGDGFPEAPVLMCLAFTHLQLSIPIDGPPPTEISIYSGQMSLSEERRIDIGTSD